MNKIRPTILTFIKPTVELSYDEIIAIPNNQSTQVRPDTVPSILASLELVNDDNGIANMSTITICLDEVSISPFFQVFF